MHLSRKDFLRISSAVAAGTLAGAPGRALSSMLAPSAAGLMGNRWLTFNCVIRVNQIEVAKDKNVGEDERSLHTPERVKAFRAAVESGFPGAKMTWAFSWLALNDMTDNYVRIRELVKEYHH